MGHSEFHMVEILFVKNVCNVNEKQSENSGFTSCVSMNHTNIEINCGRSKQ